MANKKPNFQPQGNKKSGKPRVQKDAISGVRKSKGHDSNKVHNTKGKNTHGRRSW